MRALILAVFISLGVFVVSVSASGSRNLGVLETIHGIAYPSHQGSTIILEDMAHTDLFLKEPVLAKQVKFTVTFDPQTAEAIDIGVRDNEFWLSYVKYPLYRKGIDPTKIQTKEISIPLSKALQDIDRSVDVMFFAEDAQSTPQWSIDEFHASVEFDMPTFSDIKSYAKSILSRERAL